MPNFFVGLLFAMLWASASVATKYGLRAGEPLLLANIRFFLAGAIMLVWSHVFRRNRWPKPTEFKPLAIYGLLNVAVYLGAFGLAMQQVAAGIGTLSLAVNPLLISIFSAIWRGRPILRNEWIGLLLGLTGVSIATYPLLLNSYATFAGIALLLFSMLSYSVGTVYYAGRHWDLPLLTINGWQVLLGGLLLLPVTLCITHWSHNTFNLQFWGAVGWLVFPVSIAAVQLWLYLLKKDPVKAALWLYLCPIFGFAYAAILLNEPLSIFTWIGTALVLGGLYMGQRLKK